MEPTKGYYSLIQYCPDASRLETTNLGVILYCPKKDFIQARLIDGRERVQRCFGRQDWTLFEAQKLAITERVHKAAREHWSLENFREFVSRRANDLVATEPRFVKVWDPKKELSHLFDTLVGKERPRREPGRRAETLFRQQLTWAGLNDAVITEVSVELPNLGRRFTAPFAYQNGRLNLVAPERFNLANETVRFNKACRLGVEGAHIRQLDSQSSDGCVLVVVGSFDVNQPDRPAIEQVLKEHQVTYYSFDDLSPLLTDIRSSWGMHLK